MENEDTFPDKEAPDSDSLGHPRGWQCTRLTDVRRRLVAVIKQIEREGPTKCTRDMVNYYRLLVYAYQTLASVVKDGELDEIVSRLTALEEKDRFKEVS